MSETSFAEQQSRLKQIWCKDIWMEVKKNSFLTKFLAKGDKSVITYVTELSDTNSGGRAIYQLLLPLMKDGVAGDNQREGNEEEITAVDREIVLDQLSHSVKNVGKMDDIRGNIKFANVAKPQLAGWLTDRLDQLAFLILSGISLNYDLYGRQRKDKTFSQLAFAPKVEAPTANRYRVWKGNKLVVSGNSDLTDTDLPTYKMITDMVTFAKTHQLKPIIIGGKNYYVILLNAKTLGELKKDPTFTQNIIQASQRGSDNPIFTGAITMYDGAIIHETERVFNTLLAPPGEKWGATGNVNGCRTLLCGAQALAFAKIGDGSWNEQEFDYGNKHGVNHGTIIGFDKPKFLSSYDETVEDFSVFCVDHAIPGDD